MRGRRTIGFAVLVPLAVLLAGCRGGGTGALPYSTATVSAAAATVSHSATHDGHRHSHSAPSASTSTGTSPAARIRSPTATKPRQTPDVTLTPIGQRTTQPPPPGHPSATPPAPAPTVTMRPPVTPTPMQGPQGSESNPWNLGTWAGGTSHSGLPATGSNPVWFQFEVDGSSSTQQISVSVTLQGSGTGEFGVATTAAGVNPATPFGTVHVPWTAGTYYIEVVSTGSYFIDIT
jgi:hypothetical protein